MREERLVISKTHIGEQILSRDYALQLPVVAVHDDQLADLHHAEDCMYFFEVVLLGHGEGLFNHVGAEIEGLVPVCFGDIFNFFEVEWVRLKVLVELPPINARRTLSRIFVLVSLSRIICIIKTFLIVGKESLFKGFIILVTVDPGQLVVVLNRRSPNLGFKRLILLFDHRSGGLVPCFLLDELDKSVSFDDSNGLVP